MELTALFKQKLFSQNPKPSGTTVKNYLADVQKFIRWYEATFSRTFAPSHLNVEVMKQYRKAFSAQGRDPVSVRSIERYFSSLRKFAYVLEQERLLLQNPFDAIKREIQSADTDHWNIKAFKNHLYTEKVSDLTIKNYILDIKHFLFWASRVTQITGGGKVGFDALSNTLVEEYKSRLVGQLKLSPVSVNRKLSSIRKYVAWAASQGFIVQAPSISSVAVRLSSERLIMASITAPPATEPEEQIDSPSADAHFSPGRAPLRMLNRLLFVLRSGSRLSTALFDTVLILPLAAVASEVRQVFWRLTGRKIFIPTEAAAGTTFFSRLFLPQGNEDPHGRLEFGNFRKDFYAPLMVSTAAFPLHKKALHHIRHTRPKWYKRYHKYPVAHYLHFAVLMIAMVFAGNKMYTSLVGASEGEQSFIAFSEGAPRLLAFEGEFSDGSEPTNLRFAIYSDQTASGSALVWQEVQTVTPAQSGAFQALLGSEIPLPESVFRDNHKLYLGVTIAAGEELSPRQQLANVAYATTADSLQGMVPITQVEAGESNVILALDSAGDLSIGGSATPTFQATGGSLTLAGEGLVLKSNDGSNADVVIAPDGSGKIDLQKPLYNTSEYINILGIRSAVEIEDTLSVTATESGQSALYINQNSTGDIISASSSGIARFTVDLVGAGTFADDLTIEGGDIKTTRTSFTLANENALLIEIGGDATGISIGSEKGTTTISSETTKLLGSLTIGGKTGATFLGEDADLTFSGSGTHTISAKDGTLALGNTLLSGTFSIGRDFAILPETTDGTNDLGSSERPFDTLYVQNIISPTLGGISGYWQVADNVLSPTQSTYDITVGGNATNSAKIQLFASGSSAGSIGVTGKLFFQTGDGALSQLQGGDLLLQTSATDDNASTTKAVLTNSGNFGIGLTNPTFNLQLANDSAAKPVSNTWTVASDERLKENIHSFEDGLSVINRIQPVSYTLNGKAGLPSGAKGIGILAQDVKDIIPYTISTFKARLNPNDPYETELLSFNSSALTFVTINAIKELDEKLSLQTQETSTLGEKTNTITLSHSGEFVIEQQTGTSYALKDGNGNPVMTVAAFAKGTFASIRAGFTTTQQLLVTQSAEILGVLKTFSLDAQTVTTSSLSVATDNVSIAGKSMQAYIEGVIDEYVTQNPVASPISEFGLIATNVISPLTKDASLSLRFTDQGLTITNEQDGSGSAVAVFDNAGNASFSGTLAAEQIRTDEASVSGTLTAEKVKAQELDLSEEGLANLKDKLGTNAATYITQVTSVYETNTDEEVSPTPTASPTPTPTAEPHYNSIDGQETSPSADTLSNQIVADYANIASISGQLSYIPDLQADFVQITHALMSFGPASFADIATAGQVAVGGSLILADNTINVLSGDLELQPLRQGGVRIVGGLVSITPEGDLSVAGNATFAKDVSVQGNLMANIIRPVSDQDLVFQLQDATNQSHLLVTDASQSAVLQVSGLGNLIASGSGTFKELASGKLKLIRSAQADTSLTQTIATASAGTAVITAGQKERTLISPFVTEHSLIYITPTSDTQTAAPYVARQTAENPKEETKGSFTIQIPYTVSRDITLNWWIIN